jgi:hypothetical protein
MARMNFEYGGCEFEVPLRAGGSSCDIVCFRGSRRSRSTPNDTEYPFKERNNPRKLWLAPN